MGDLCVLCKPIFAGYIYRYLSKRHLPLSMSEDLLQDTYVAVCKSFPYYDPSSENIIPLMKTIVRRVCAAEADRKANRLRTVPMSNIDGTDEDSEDSEWTVTDAMVVSAWMAENSPEYTEGPIAREKATTPKRPRLYKTPPKPKKARARRLSGDELQRREKSRQEWAAELQTAG